MTIKEKFIEEVKNANINFSEDAKKYFDGLCAKDEKPQLRFTENGLKIFEAMKNEKDNYNNSFKAKEIAEILGVSSRTVSGSIRKLITDGYVEKIGENPVVYMLTALGDNTEATND